MSGWVGHVEEGEKDRTGQPNAKDEMTKHTTRWTLERHWNVPAPFGGLDVLLGAEQRAPLRFKQDVVPKFAERGEKGEG